MDCHTGPPYAFEIPHGSSGHTKLSKNYRVAAKRCADRGAEIGERRYSFDLLSRDCEIRHQKQEVIEELDFRLLPVDSHSYVGRFLDKHLGKHFTLTNFERSVSFFDLPICFACSGKSTV